MRFIHFSLVLCCVLFCLSGCSFKPANPEGRLDVSGTITLNGGPFEKAHMASIIFEPIDDPSSGSSTTSFSVLTGKFLCTMQNGLKPGKYRVRILAYAQYDKRTKQPIDLNAPPETNVDEIDGKSYYVALLPPEFNDNSAIEFEVVKSRKNVFDYNIETSFVPDTTPP